MTTIRFISPGVTITIIASVIPHEVDQVDIYSAQWGFQYYGAMYFEEVLLDAVRHGATVCVTVPRCASQRHCVVRHGAPVHFAVRHSASVGRDGKGSVYVFSSGNLNGLFEDINTSMLDQLPELNQVGAIDDRGAPQYYMTPGDGVMVVAYCGAVDPDSLRSIVVAIPVDFCYKAGVAGTSFFSPMVTGAVALTLQANPDLTWRDVYHILIELANIENLIGNDIFRNWAGLLCCDMCLFYVNYQVFKLFNGRELYLGFGLVNEEAMVTLAQSWENVGDQVICDTGDISVNG
ncbi:NECB-like protein [Mya arenaria]|uniref:NECB-like protein n=1 Tax=Mya arenaria TaxID=6604 RepID=A0ABY7GBI2_MYAAR|nr:NECB-like protein [Mya arenaria]